MLLLAGCVGGSIAQTPIAAANNTLAVGSALVSATLTDPTGYVANFALPATADGSSGTVAVSISTLLPAGVVAPSSTHRAPETIGATLTPLVYVTVRPSATVTFSSTPAFSFTLPRGTALITGSSAFVAFYDPAQSATGWVTILGPGSVSGQTISFPATTGTLKLAGGALYTFVLFTTSQALTSTAPGAPLTVTPAAVAFGGLGSSFAKTVALTESSGTAPPAITNYAFSPSTCPNTSFSYTPSPGPGALTTTLTIFQTLMITTPTCTLALTDQFNHVVNVTLTTATPPTLAVTPAAVTLAGVGTSYAATVTATESNGSLVNLQSIGYSPACPGFSFTNGAGAANLAIQVFAVQPIVGSCTLVLTDMAGNTAKVTVTLPSTSVSVGGT